MIKGLSLCHIPLSYALDDRPGGLGGGGGGDLVWRGLAGAGLGNEVGVLVSDEGANKPEVVAGGGEDAVLAIGNPTGNAVFDFGRAVYD